MKPGYQALERDITAYCPAGKMNRKPRFRSRPRFEGRYYRTRSSNSGHWDETFHL